MSEFYENRTCACGCGQKIRVSFCHKYQGIAKYIHGHNSKVANPNLGKSMSEEQKKKISKTKKGKKLSFEHRKKISEGNKRAYREGRRTAYKYSFNENAFDVLTPESVYWLGFIYADGSIDDGRGILRITLHKKDRIVLEEFKKFLGANHPIYEYSYKIDDFATRETAQLQIVSKKLVGRLNLLGVYQNKTKDIEFPQFLPRNLHSDFIRGYFDGDGSLSTNGKNSGQTRFGITSQPKFLEKIQKILMDNCGLRKTKFSKYKGKISVSMSYGGNKQVKRILVYLTKNEGFYLPRKIGRWLPSRT